MEPYHPFVFDETHRCFVGNFEGMYRAEEEQGFDSWNQDDLSQWVRRLELAVIDRPWQSVLDFGCGKGAFSSRIRAERVLGVDVSPTAIAKAATRYPTREWRVLDRPLPQLLDGERFELALAVGVLSYLPDWRGTLQALASAADHVFVSLYLPPDPIGFVKTFEELRGEVETQIGAIDVEVFVRSASVLMLLT